MMSTFIILLSIHRYSHRQRDAPPEARRELGIDQWLKLVPLWEVRLEALSGHTCIFGGIDGATALTHDCIQFFKQLQRLLTIVGEVERQRQSRPGEGEHARRRHIAKFL